MDSESDRRSPGSAGSTSGSKGRATKSSSNAKSTSTDEGCSLPAGPTSPASRTFVKSQSAHDPEDCERWEETEQAMTLTPHGQGLPAKALAVNLRGREEGARAELAEAASLRAASGGSSRSYLLTSSAEDSPAKTSPSPDDDEDSPESDPASSLSLPESQTLFSPMGDGSSLRTYPDSFPPTADEISPSYSRRWPSSGFTTSPGECWTADTSECPSDGGAFSSLPDVLEADVPPRFFLSPRAAAGILRRAERRGRELPPALAEALAALASAHPDDGKRTTKTSSESSTADRPPDDSTSTEPTSMLWIDEAEEQTTTKPKPVSSSPTPSDPKASTPAKMGLDEAPRSSPEPSAATCDPAATTPEASSVRHWSLDAEYSNQEAPQADETGPLTRNLRKATTYDGTVRRLTPTECERLQGFPDGWTVI